MVKNSPLTKNIGWNGICLKTPQTWEIDSLDAVHLIIGENGSPRTEIKWTDAPKHFSLEKYLKKFIFRSQKSLGIKIHELPTPQFFTHPNPDFEFFFFAWESGTSKGNGTLIFCSQCKRLTMIRFFSDSRILLNSPAHLILMSYLDHPEGDKVDWDVFGFNFAVLKWFKLLEYSFKPGCYIINLKHKKTILTAFSWGPASFLLSEKTLCEFAFQRLPQLKGFATAGVCVRGNYLEWSYRHGRFKNAELLPFLNRYLFFTVFRICHDIQSNRIFGIMADSPEKFETALIKGSMIGDR